MASIIVELRQRPVKSGKDWVVTDVARKTSNISFPPIYRRFYSDFLWRGFLHFGHNTEAWYRPIAFAGITDVQYGRLYLQSYQVALLLDESQCNHTCTDPAVCTSVQINHGMVRMRRPQNLVTMGPRIPKGMAIPFAYMPLRLLAIGLRKGTNVSHKCKLPYMGTGS